MQVEIRVLMMTDRVGSSTQTARLTHDEIARVSEDHRCLTEEVMQRWKGTELKDTGDGYFVSFPSAYDAACAGLYLQKLAACRNASLPENLRGLTFELRVGLHVGDVNVLPDGDVRGTPANVSARVESTAPAGCVLATPQFKEASNPNELDFEDVGEHDLKGLGKVRLWKLTDRRQAEFQNPFLYQTMWRWPREFFARDAQVADILGRLDGGMSVAITGDRYVGKSWLLAYLAYRLQVAWGAGRPVVYCDLNSAQLHTRAGLLAHLAGGLGLAKAPRRASLARFEGAVRAAIGGGSSGVVLLDHFEKLADLRDQFGDEMLESFRALQQARALVFLTASRTTPADIVTQHRLTSTFPGVLTGLKLPDFTHEEARRFVCAPRPEIGFSQQEAEEILHAAGTKPIRLQIACFCAASARSRGRRVADGLIEAGSEPAFRG